MKIHHFLLSTSVLFTAALFAQSGAPASSHDSTVTRLAVTRPHGPLLRAIDADRDGTLSADELRLAPIALTAFDLDDDGSLLRDEISPDHMAHARRAVFRVTLASSRPFADTALLLVLDANHDGIVQAIEVSNAASSLRRLDTNGDGAVTPDELRAIAAETRVAAAANHARAGNGLSGI